MAPSPITPQFLDELVDRTDAAGGPGSTGAARVWSEMHGIVSPDDLARFDGVDPFSSRYGELQLELWHQWSGRDYDPITTEHTGFDLEAHLGSRTAYGPHVGPLVLSHHHLAVMRAVSALGLDGSTALEIGAGWGLQAELLSVLGFEVDVVDVNPAFLDLIARRRGELGMGGHQIAGTFTDFTTPRRGYDLAYSYEALHHAPQPLEAIRHLVDPGGVAARCVAFVGEPVVDMWPTWGLRIDQESLYCTRKFGWFESGWTEEFIMSCVARVGLGVHFMRPASSVRDGAILGARVSMLDEEQRETWTPFVAGWSTAGEGLMAMGESSLAFGVDDHADVVVLDLGWYNARPSMLSVLALCGEHVERIRTELVTGRNRLALRLPDGMDRVVTLSLAGETWCPHAVLGSDDRRRISVDVLGVRTASTDDSAQMTPIGRATAQPVGATAWAKQRLRRALYSSA